jgi:phosphoribosylamine--glycine ligase
MGAYSPAPVITGEMADTVMERIVTPTIEGMAALGRPYKGVLYAGLMIDADGPKVLEYNVRFGDPECQPLMLRLKSDLLEVLVACAEGRLDEAAVEWHADTALTVVMAAKGYPGPYEKGTEIKGLDALAGREDVVVFHAGTMADGGRVLANGGRVLGVTARGATVVAAQENAYQAIDRIEWPDGFCRRDIGWRAIGR